MRYFVIFLILFGTVLPAFGQYMGNLGQENQSTGTLESLGGPAIRHTPDYYYIIPAIIVSAIIGGVIFVIWRKKNEN